MKILLLSVFMLFVSISTYGQDPEILKVGDRSITKSEFLQIYLKNNSNPQYDKATLDEYMELFKKFKLKVLEAEAQGYDTIPKLKNELEGYRKQLATPYLIDSAKNKQLVLEGYERMKQEVSASHILIRCEPDALPFDTLAAYNKALELRKRILKGEDFATVARSPGGSEDESVKQNGGALGYFSAFQMVYPFENAAFTTPVGGVSLPVRTRFGYHLVKVHDKRPARGVMTAAHIMIVVKKSADEKTQENAEQRIREIYQKLQEGESWESLVSKYTEDYGSKNSGGQITEFGSGKQRMVHEFEDAAFSIPTNGAYSEPIRTDYGWHIIKRIDLKPIGSFESLQKEIQQKVNRDERALSTQKSFIEKLKKDYKLKDNGKKQLKWFYKNAKSDNGTMVLPASKKDPKMFSFSSVVINRSDFVAHLKSMRDVPIDVDLKGYINTQYQTFIDQQVLAYEEAQLEEKHPAFKALMTEYHDGVLLYEIMNDQVWNKALRDTSGLRTYFNANRGQFMWDERVDAQIFICDSRDVAQQVDSLLNNSMEVKDIVKEANGKSALNVTLKDQKFEVNATEFLKGRKLVQGKNNMYEFNGKYYIVLVNEFIPAGEKELEETKGAATAAYQQYLEEQWVQSLFAKYPIVVNTEVLYNLGK